MESLTAKRLRELLQYNEETGIFTWATRRQRVSIGSAVGALTDRGYVVIDVMGRRYKAHRLAWLYVFGEWPKGDIDHINCHRADNRISNLRDVSRSVNRQNQRTAKAGSVTGLLGVSFDKDRRKYVAQININGKVKKIGRFDSAKTAHEAYLREKRKHHMGCTI